MHIEKVSDRGQNNVQGTTFKPKDFTRIDSEKLVLDSRKAFLIGGNSPHAKPLPTEWVERHQEDSIETLDEKIKRYKKSVEHCNKHKRDMDKDWYTNLVKKLRWFENRKEELSGGAGAS